MHFYAAKWPDAVTFQWLIDNDMNVGLHCHPCGRHVIVFDELAAVPARDAGPVAGRPVQVHTMRIYEDGGAA